MAPTNICPQCGLRNREGAAFGAHCGSQLEGPPVARKAGDDEASKPKDPPRETEPEVFDVWITWIPPMWYAISPTKRRTGAWHVTGRVRNNSHKTLLACNLVGTILDGDGRKVHGFDTMLEIGVPPGEVRGFDEMVRESIDP